MIHLGRHSYMGEIQEKFDPQVKVGNFTSIASGVTFMGGCQHPQTVSTFPFTDKEWCDESVYPKSYGRKASEVFNIVIGSDCWIGEGVVLMDGVTLNDGCIVAAYSVVTKDVQAYSIVGGSPAVVIRERYMNGVWVHNVIDQLKRIAWWNWDDDKIKEAIPLMTDVNKFIERYG